MALTQLTKIDGGGISTTSDYRVGVITATKFIGPFEGSTGTFSGNITAVDGTFSGNVTVGGTLTYEDVTNIDSVGILTARAGIIDSTLTSGRVTYAGVGGRLTDSGNLTFNGTDLAVAGKLSCDVNSDISMSGSAAGQLIVGGNGYTSAIALDGDAMHIYHNSSSRGLVLGTNETERLRIRYDGKVGIGTDNPGELLDVYKASNDASIKVRTTTAGAWYYADSASSGYHGIRLSSSGTEKWFVGSYGTNNFQIKDGSASGGTLRFTIVDGTGKVGIGTNLPVGTLDIFNANADASNTNSLGAQINAAWIRIGDVDAAGKTFSNGLGTKLYNQGTAHWSYGMLGQDFLITNTSGDGAKLFPSNRSTHFFIKSDGKVGIGTENPGRDLHIKGTGNALVKMEGDYSGSVTGIEGVLTASGANRYVTGVYGKVVNTSGSESNVASIRLWNEQASPTTSDSPGYITFNTTNDGASTATEKLRIFSNGRIGIGTDTAPRDMVHLHNPNANASSYIQFTNANTAGTGINDGTLIGISQNNSNTDGTGSGFTILNKENAEITLGTNNLERLRITSAGHILPGAAGTQDLGSTSKEFRHLYLGDSGKAYFGLDQDFSIWHNNSHGLIKNTTGRLYLLSDDLWVKNEADNKTSARFMDGGEVFLYNNDTLRLTTTSTGITVGGEVAATQDYPNYRPTLDLNFAAVKKLDPRIAYYRTGPASYIDEFGKVVLVGGNTPRFDHDPTTRESKGLLIEESKTNLIPHSFDKGVWNSGSAGTLTRNAGIAPDGTMTATKASTTSNDIDTSPSIGPASEGASTQITISGSTTYTLSIWAKASTIAQVGNNFKVRWKRITGDGSSSETTFALTADWKRYSTTGTTAANNTTMACYVGGVANSEALVWGAQLEVSSFPTSLIPTYGSSATRGADAAFMDAIGDSFYNQNEGTSIVEYNYTEDTDGAHTLFSFTGTESDPEASNPRQWLRINKTAGTPRTIRYSLTTDAGSSSDDTSSAVATPGQWDKFAFAYTSGDQDLYLNGSSVNDLSRTPPINCYRLAFGTAGWALTTETVMLEGHIRRFMYYPKKLPNSQLGTLTS